MRISTTFGTLTALLCVMALQTAARPVFAAEAFPRSGVFTEPDSESELNFGTRYLGFPDETCTFKSPKKLNANSWRITTTCTTADPPKTSTSTATLEKRGKTWRLTRGEFVLDFSP
jgi:hypothetical protein